jgi:ABC-type multidrug transport system fused ATPase/permease subunit
MAVSSEAPPEPLARPMALVFGAGLPAAAAVEHLVEGYGLLHADLADPEPQLRGRPLPSIATAEGELRAGMLLSFVRFLVERHGQEVFLRFLGSARPDSLDASCRELYGAPLGALEEEWRRNLAGAGDRVKTAQFLRLTLRYLRPHTRRELESVVYMLLGMGFTILFAKMFERVIDTDIPSGEISEVLQTLAILGIGFAISMVANLRRAYLTAYVSSSIVRTMRTEMFDRMQTLSADWYHRHQQGDVLARMFNDVAVLEFGLSQILREGAFQMLSVVVFSIALFTINVPLAIIVVVGAPLVAFVYRAMASGALKRSMAVQEQTGQALTIATENYGAQSVVRSYALEDRERRRFDRASERLFRSEVRLQVFGGLFGVTVNMIVTFLRLVVLGLGAYLIIEGNFTIGGLAAFMTMMGEVITPTTSLTTIGQQMQEATGALVRINEIRDALPDIADTPDATQLPRLSGEIRLEGVGFSYTLDRRALDDVDAVIAAGSRVAFVGATGSGKSSILLLLMRFYDPDDGAVRYDGHNLRGVTLESLRAQLGVVFQETFLFDTTIRENIALGNPSASNDQVEAAARAAELHDFVMSLPQGYDTVVGERGGRLSGGQKQRLAIARALVRDPAVLILDEATSALDPRTERLIAATLDHVATGRTTIAVTHRLTSVTHYDRLFVVHDGKLVETGTHEELLQLGGVYAQLWGEQTGSAPHPELPFDARGALVRIPLFAALETAELAQVEGRLRAMELAPGEQLPEGGGKIAIVQRGRARRLVPGLQGSMGPVTDLGPGDAFGVNALLGDETGSVLEALERTTLLVLDDEAIAVFAAMYPSVSAALTGGAATAAPVGGHRLSRVTWVPGTAPRRVPSLPTVTEGVRSSTGPFPGASHDV